MCLAKREKLTFIQLGEGEDRRRAGDPLPSGSLWQNNLFNSHGQCLHVLNPTGAAQSSKQQNEPLTNQ
ncbi:hypothetical protein NQZ68_008363 [Dissostichus eleginoides]|nr:hypothetical protein NQZ68_008363 [Dissostichus eleginoides]